MHPVGLFLLSSLALCLVLPFGAGQAIWPEDLSVICGNAANTSCADQHLASVYSSLTRLHNPDMTSSNFTFLDHPLYASNNNSGRLNASALNSTEQLSLANYTQQEKDIVQAFPKND